MSRCLEKDASEFFKDNNKKKYITSLKINNHMIPRKGQTEMKNAFDESNNCTLGRKLNKAGVESFSCSGYDSVLKRYCVGYKYKKKIRSFLITKMADLDVEIFKDLEKFKKELG